MVLGSFILVLGCRLLVSRPSVQDTTRKRKQDAHPSIIGHQFAKYSRSNKSLEDTAKSGTHHVRHRRGHLDLKESREIDQESKKALSRFGPWDKNLQSRNNQ